MATVVDILKYIITGDNKGLVDAAKGGDAAVNKMSSNIASGLEGLARKWLMVGLAAFSFNRILKDTVGAAIESEAAYNSLAVAVDASGVNWKENEKQIRAFLDTLQKTTRFSDEEGAQALQILTEAGMSVEQAMSLMGRAADAAVARNMRLTEVAEILGTAFQGNARGARQLGIILRDTQNPARVLSDLLEKMNERFSGQAQRDLTKAVGQWQQFKNLIREIGERTGNVLLPAINNLLGKLTQPLKFPAFFDPAFTQKLAQGKAFADVTGKIAANILAFQITQEGRKPAPIIDTPSPEALHEAAMQRLAIRRKTLEEIAKMEGDNAALVADAQVAALQEITDAEQKRFQFQRDMGRDTFTEELAFLEQIKKSAEAEGLFDFADKIAKQIQELNNKVTLDSRAKWEKNFHLLLDNTHRLASEFGRFMSAAIEDFLHTAIDAISEIKDSIKQIKLGGLAGAGGFVGLAGAAFGVIGSIVDMFSSGTEVIRKSNLELIGAIREWISNLRGSTKEQIGATRDQILKIKELVASDNLFVRQKGIHEAQMLEGFDAVAALFQKAAGRSGTVEEILNFWLEELRKQGSTFGVIATGLKSVSDVEKFLKDQTKLDFQTGRQFIEFFASQNKFTPEQQKVLFEDLLAILQASGNITTSELIDLTELIRQLSEGQGITEETLKEIQITRSVASITENQANLVVGFLQTIAATTQSILETIESAVGGLTAVPFGGGTQIQAGAIVINAGAQSAQAISAQLVTDLRAKGVKV